MAAFSSSSFHHHHPFLLDSVFLPNSPSTTDNKNSMSMSPPILHQLPDTQNLVSMENSSSIVTDKYDNKKRKCKEASSSNSAQSKDKREVKGKKNRKGKDDEEKKKNSKEERKGEEVGYIHVRARRGQATDSHSLAERVRRERISERMKLLQSLVPGCDKVTGKALMLDEIINYIQSLQNQVEFLSMKLTSVNPMFYDFGVDFESFMVRPHQDLSELPSQIESMQECSPKTSNNYNFLDNNSANPILFQQAQLPNVLQGSRQTLWEVDDHTQTIINQSEFNSSCPTTLWQR